MVPLVLQKEQLMCALYCYADMATVRLGRYPPLARYPPATASSLLRSSPARPYACLLAHSHSA